MIVLGIDPGFADLGYGVVELGKDWEELLFLGVIRTKKANKKLNMLATDDNVVRMRILYTGLADVLAKCEAAGMPVQAIATESQSWPRNAGATAKVGMAWGVVVSLACERSLAIVQASPQQIKDSITGNKSASKEEVRAALGAMPGMEKLEQLLGTITARSVHEHPVDAVAAVMTCRDSTAIQIGRKM